MLCSLRKLRSVNWNFSGVHAPKSKMELGQATWKPLYSLWIMIRMPLWHSWLPWVSRVCGICILHAVSCIPSGFAHIKLQGTYKFHTPYGTTASCTSWFSHTMSDLGLCHDYIIPAFFPIIPSNVDTSFTKYTVFFKVFLAFTFNQSTCRWIWILLSDWLTRSHDIVAWNRKLQELGKNTVCQHIPPRSIMLRA